MLEPAEPAEPEPSEPVKRADPSQAAEVPTWGSPVGNSIRAANREVPKTVSPRRLDFAEDPIPSSLAATFAEQACRK